MWGGVCLKYNAILTDSVYFSFNTLGRRHTQVQRSGVISADAGPLLLFVTTLLFVCWYGYRENNREDSDCTR